MVQGEHDCNWWSGSWSGIDAGDTLLQYVYLHIKKKFQKPASPYYTVTGLICNVCVKLTNLQHLGHKFCLIAQKTSDNNECSTC